MRPVVHIHYMLDRELSISLGCRQTLVAKKFLDRAQVGSFFEHVGTESVSKRVWMNVRRESFGNRNSFHDSPYRSGGETASALVDEEGGVCFLPGCEQLLAPG